MPAAPSSPIPVVLDHLAEAVASDGDGVGVGAGLLTALAGMPDPRKRRGVRHSVATIMVVAACAALAGCRSFSAIGQWAADASQEVRTALGIGDAVPCESTIRRVLQRLDGDTLDAALGSWAAERTAPDPGAWRALALDGKRLRGSASATTPARHVLGAVDHAHGVVLAQREITDKTSEISEFAPLLDTLDLAGAVVTADALHTQRGHADYLTRRGAHYLLTVKGNQPGLHAQLKALPWKQAPVLHTSEDRGHGRVERRRIKVVTVATGILFPRARQAIRISRTTRTLNNPQWTTEIAYAITSLTAEHADPAELAGWVRGHWRIENRLHWVRDVTFDEDRSQIRTANGPRIMACLRNLTINLHRLAGATNIAAALRHHAWNALRPVTLLLTS